MRVFVAACVALVASTVVVFADDDTMDARFGNTVLVKLQNGPEVHMYYNADHTFTGKVTGMDFKLAGTWAMQGANICLTYKSVPPGQQNPTCNVYEVHKLGDTWTADGRTISLVPGIQ